MNKLFQKDLFWVLLIVVATFFAYIKIIHFDFVYWDDDKQLFNNYFVTIFSIEHLKHNLFLERFTFIPLTIFSAVYHVFGKNATVFHSVSLWFHLVNIILFYIVLKKFNFSSFVNLLSVLLFALHPLRIESVAWISEWKDLLFTFFSLLGIWVYICWTKQRKKYLIGIYILLAWAAGFSKVQGLLLPFSVLLLDIFLTKKFNWKHTIFQLAVFAFVLFSPNKKAFVALLLAIILWYIYQRYLKSKLIVRFNFSKKWFPLLLLLGIIMAGFLTKKLWFWTGANSASMGDRFLYASYAMTFYLKQFFLPYQQLAIHPYPAIYGLALWKQWGLFSLIWIFTGIFLWFLIKSKWENKFKVLGGILFFFLNISVVLHIIPIEGRLIVAERYTYFAYSGLFVASALVVEVLFHRISLYAKPILLLLLGIILISMTYMRVDIWKNTETLFNDVIIKKPNTSFAWTNLGSYFLEKKEYSKAEKYYRQAIILNPFDVQNYLNKALVLVALNKTEESLSILSEGINKSTLREDKSMFLVTQGQIYAQQGNNSKAMQLYNQSVHLYNKNYKAYLQKSMLFANDASIRNIDSAIFLAQKAIELNSYYADAYHTLGWLYLIKGNIQKANEQVQKAIELNPYMAIAFNSRGYIAFIQGDYEHALNDYTHALELDSSLIEVRKNRAWLYFQSKQYDLAVKDYTQILKKIPVDIIALINNAFANTYLSNFNKATLAFKKAMQLYPDSAIFKQNLGWCFMQAKQLDSAIFYYSRALSLNPTLINSLFNRGYLYILKKEPEKALLDFTYLQKLTPKNAEVYFWLGESERLKGNKDKACSLYNKSLSMGFVHAKNAISKYCEKK
jgi:tetratricopeptide (TPR) repeat protein